MNIIIAIVCTLISVYFIPNKFLIIAEISLFFAIITASRMDIKTMSIDGNLSTFIMSLLVLLSFFYSDLYQIVFSIGFLIICGLVIFFLEKKLNKCIIGRADVECFIGMIPHFDLFLNLFFITLSGIMGILTKIIINIFNKNNKSIKEFPFLPAIFVAFYLTRLFAEFISSLRYLFYL